MIAFIFGIKRKIQRLIFNLKYRNRFLHQDFDITFRCDNVAGFKFGKRCYIGPGCHFDALGGVELEDFAIIGPHVKIWSYNHDFKSECVPYGGGNEFKSVRIGKGAWIAMQVVLMPGCDIGEGSIVAAGSIVRGKIPPYSFVRPAYAEWEPLAVQKDTSWFYRESPCR